eukprot:6897780-Lingulodinium_polyedra.AAC.1
MTRSLRLPSTPRACPVQEPTGARAERRAGARRGATAPACRRDRGRARDEAATDGGLPGD